MLIGRRILLLVPVTLVTVVRVYGQATAPVPDLQELLKHSDESVQASDAKQREYRYVSLQRLEGWNSSHDVTEETVAMVYPVDGTVIERKILKNRSPLDAKEQLEVDKSVAKQIAAAAKARGKPARSLPDDMNMSDLVRLGTFTALERRTLDGRSILTTHFQGNPKAHTSGAVQKFASRRSGTFIFDEKDGALQSIEAKLDEDVSFALVLKVKKGLHVQMHYTRLAEGLWVPKDLVCDGSGRLFFNALAGHMEMHYYAFRKVVPLTDDPYRGKHFGELDPEVRNDLVSWFNNPDDESGIADLE